MTGLAHLLDAWVALPLALAAPLAVVLGVTLGGALVATGIVVWEMGCASVEEARLRWQRRDSRTWDNAPQANLSRVRESHVGQDWRLRREGGD